MDVQYKMMTPLRINQAKRDEVKLSRVLAVLWGWRKQKWNECVLLSNSKNGLYSFQEETCMPSLFWQEGFCCPLHQWAILKLPFSAIIKPQTLSYTDMMCSSGPSRITISNIKITDMHTLYCIAAKVKAPFLAAASCVGVHLCASMQECV